MVDKAAADQELLCRFGGCQRDAYELCRECRCCYCEDHADHASHFTPADSTPADVEEAATRSVGGEVDNATAEDSESDSEDSPEIPKRGAKAKATATRKGGSNRMKSGGRVKKLAAYASSDEVEDSEDEEVDIAPTQARTVAALCIQPTATRGARPPQRSSAIACSSKNSELLSGAIDYEQSPHLLYGSQVHRCVMYLLR